MSSADRGERVHVSGHAEPGAAPGAAGIQSAIDVIAVYALLACLAGLPAGRGGLGDRWADRQRLHRGRRQDRDVHRGRRRVLVGARRSDPAVGLRARLDAHAQARRHGAPAARSPACSRPRAAGGGAARRRRGGRATAPPAAVELVGGVPVGVQDTPAGALAAADNYVAIASQSSSRTRPCSPRSSRGVCARGARPHAREARQRPRRRRAEHAQLRAGRPGVAVIAARRLDSYTPQRATVTSWLGGFVWGPHLSPRQSWNLVDTTLRWQAGRWLVRSLRHRATPAPVPVDRVRRRRQQPERRRSRASPG